ncbi:glycosyltransferase family 4 protein [Brunnivagina elsteri]|nr:glycosyltransferase family 4 protein [Calothrix elsteri]
MRILFLNNCPTDLLWSEWLEKKSPGQHLWGVNHLFEHGIYVDVLPYSKYEFLKKISNKIKLLGDLDQQLRTIPHLSKYDAVYCGCQHDTLVLGLMKRLGLIRVPIAIIVHHCIKPIFRNKLLFNLFYSSNDKFICLNEIVRHQLIDDFHISPEKVTMLEWGVDTDFYDLDTDKISPQETPFIITAGRTLRDFNTLVEAFTNSPYHLKIYCTEDAEPTIENIPPNVNIYSQKKLISSREILPEYQKSFAIAVPMLEKKEQLIGLTSLLDGMAVGKPIIMTRNQLVNIDIEKENIGIWVEPGDVQGWKNAIAYLFEHPEEAKAMGKRAKKLCETKYNTRIFATKLACVLNDIPTKKITIPSV